MTGRIRKALHSIECRPTDEHVVVSVDGQVLADTRRATLLVESRLPDRYYIPPEDVRTELLVPSRHRTVCPFKGEASYWSVQVGDEQLADVAWCYEEARDDGAPVRGLIAFDTERLDLSVDPS